MEGGQPLLAGRVAQEHVRRQGGARVGHDKLDKGEILASYKAFNIRSCALPFAQGAFFFGLADPFAIHPSHIQSLRGWG